MTTTHRFAAVFTAAALFTAPVALAPVASASPICAHRGAAHAAAQHQTREADSRWHVAHGELPTCGLDDDSDHRPSTGHRSTERRDDHDNGHKWWRNDGIGPHRDPHPIWHSITGH